MLAVRFAGGSSFSRDKCRSRKLDAFCLIKLDFGGGILSALASSFVFVVTVNAELECVKRGAISQLNCDSIEQHL